MMARRQGRYGTGHPLATVALLACLLCLVPGGCSPDRFEATEARVIGDDVARFYSVVDSLRPDAQVSTIRRALDDGYIAGATPGVASFMNERIGSTAKLAEVYASNRAFYTRIRPTMLALSTDASVQARVRAAFGRINQWIPEARFPHAYLVIGRMSTGGTTGMAGLLIGLEVFSRTPDLDLSGYDRWTRESFKSPDSLVHTIVHEAVHTLQRSGPGASLLAAALHEGMCDFIATLATGRGMDNPTYRYARTHERGLWHEFSGAMRGGDRGDWLYRLPGDPSRPPDLGYAIGYLICERYYDGAADKPAAVRAMIDMRDAEEFLRASRYGTDW